MNRPDNKDWTVGRLLTWTVRYLREKGLEEPTLTAQLLLSKALGCSRLDLYMSFDKDVGEEARSRFKGLIKRAVAGEPVAYILGYKEFFSIPIKVRPSVLIPRPETEFLVQYLIRDIRNTSRFDGTILIADVGIGSGCISIAIAKHIGKARIIGTDISDSALAVAAENIREYGLTDRIELVKTDLLLGLEGSRFDYIVSNPPYVSESDYERLPRTIRDYEPKESLLAGPDGLSVIRRLIITSKDYLAMGGKLIFEIGYNQAESVRKLLDDEGYSNIDFEKDLSGVDRIAIASKS